MPIYKVPLFTVNKANLLSKGYDESYDHNMEMISHLRKINLLLSTSINSAIIWYYCFNINYSEF